MKVKIKLTEEMLGTANANPELHREFIASKSADADKVKEEMEALPAEDLMEKSLTVFPRDSDGTPILYDYQIKGFVKEAAGVLIEIAGGEEIKVGKTKLTKFTYKRIVDNYIFIQPRMIRLAPVSGVCTRPLRAETMRGERVALASSETVSAGTEFEIEINILSDTLVDLVKKCLDYGALKGIGQWRNSGKGRFVWQAV